MSNKSKSLIWKIIIIILISFFLILISAFLFIAFFLPIPDNLHLQNQNISTKIYDRNGTLLYQVLDPHSGKKTYVNLDQIPQKFIQAIISAEDKDFFEHQGIDLQAISRALFYNALNQKVTSGASTITQQLVRNLLGTNRQRTFKEKLIEAVYAIRISHLYSKDQVLEKYLNTVYFGNLSYGIYEASQNYFGKNIQNLDLAEMTILAGLPQSPSSLNPLINLQASKKRQSYILAKMLEQNLITQAEKEQAENEILFFQASKNPIEAPHFVFHILNQLEEEYGPDYVYSGLNITTTLDLNLQNKAQEIVNFQLEKLQEKNVTNSAVLAVDLPSGQILVWLGSKNYFDPNISGQVDIITSQRQPGSALKPFLYLLALQKGYTMADILEDLPLNIKTETGIYAPLNYDLDFHGPVRMKEALANSFNIPAVRLQQQIGTDTFLAFLRQLGLNTLNQSPDFYGFSLTLGGGEIRLFDLANAYFTLSNYGNQKSFSTILKITDSQNKTIFNWSNPPSHNILGQNAKQYAFLIIDALSDNNARLKSFGEDNVLNLPFPVVAKTGTTRSFKDNWTFGFSRNILTSVWVGNSDASAMQEISGIDGAGPIWRDFMLYFDKYQSNQQNKNFIIPENITQISICAISGLLPTKNCQSQVLQYFLKGTEPKKYDYFWREFNCGPDIGEKGTEIVLAPFNGGQSENDGIDQIPLLRGGSVADGMDQSFSNTSTKYFISYPYPYQNWAETRNFQPPINCQQVKTSNNQQTSQNQANQPIQFISPLNNDTFQIIPEIPLENQKINFKMTIHPQLINPNAQLVKISLDHKPFKEISIENQNPLEIKEKWIPVTGNHTLKIEIFSDSQKLSSTNQISFLIN